MGDGILIVGRDINHAYSVDVRRNGLASPTLGIRPDVIYFTPGWDEAWESDKRDIALRHLACRVGFDTITAGDMPEGWASRYG